jgi:hypothetical protein
MLRGAMRFRPLIISLVIVSLLAVFGLASLLHAADSAVDAKKGLRLQVEREHHASTDRITVYICNNTEEALTFETGAAGGPGSLDDRVQKVSGSPPTVVPTLTFELSGDRYVTLRPPAFGGPTMRSMRSTVLKIEPGMRYMYCSFSVPSEYTAGKLAEVKLCLPDRTEILGFDDAFIEKAAQ